MFPIRHVFAVPSLVVLALLAALPACSYLSPYRIDVRQGNYVTQTMLAQLSPGMTQEQVRYIMGSPLLVDPFHKDRWDYVYRLSPGYGTTEQRHITVVFQDSKLLRLEGDVVAASGKPGSAEPVVPRVIDIGAPSSTSSTEKSKAPAASSASKSSTSTTAESAPVATPSRRPLPPPPVAAPAAPAIDSSPDRR